MSDSNTKCIEVKVLHIKSIYIKQTTKVYQIWITDWDWIIVWKTESDFEKASVESTVFSIKGKRF